MKKYIIMINMLCVVVLSGFGEEIKKTANTKRVPHKKRNQYLVDKNKPLSSFVRERLRVVNLCDEPKTNQTEKLIFREYPKNLTSENRYAFCYKNLCHKYSYVNYREIEFKKGKRLCVYEVMIPSDVGKSQFLNVSICSVIKTEKGNFFSYLKDDSMKCDFGQRYNLGMPDGFLGFLPNPKGDVPLVAYLFGPGGSGSFWAVIVYYYDEKKNRWIPSSVYSNAGSRRSFSYNEKTYLLRYKLLGDDYSVPVMKYFNSAGPFAEKNKKKMQWIKESNLKTFVLDEPYEFNLPNENGQF